MTVPRAGAPSLFKYLKREHGAALLGAGTLRISTLYEFQDEERYGGEIGDKSEGVRTVYADEDFDIDHVPEFAKGTLIRNPQDHKNIEFRGIMFSLDRTSPNLYIYSTCEVFERGLLAQLGREVCVEIFEVDVFFRALTTHLQIAGIASELLHLGPCQYRQRREHHSAETNLHPAIVKASEYANQREVRAVWQPSTSKVEPVVLTVPEVMGTVRLISPP